MNQDNIRKIVQQKTIPWLKRSQAFEAEEIPVGTPQYVIDDRRRRIQKDHAIESKIREYAPHAGVALDVATSQMDDGLGLWPLLVVVGGLSAGGLYTVNKWLDQSDKERAQIDKANDERLRAESIARAEGLDQSEIDERGQIAYEKSMGTYQRSHLVRNLLIGGAVLGGGFLLLQIIKEVKK